jgi:hypothetical protein
MLFWIWSIVAVLSVCLLIAVNEREQWEPRVARTIPRRWWLRASAFLFFSGAAGGVLWACLLCAGCWLAYPLLTAGWLSTPPRPVAANMILTNLVTATLMFGYTYCYALTAVFLRNTLIKIQPIYTWILSLALLALGSALPYLASFLLHYRDWAFSTHYRWLLTDPIAGMLVVSDHDLGAEKVAIAFVLAWAALVTALNGRWFIRQMRRFRTYAVRTASGGESLSALLSATPTAATRAGP